MSYPVALVLMLISYITDVTHANSSGSVWSSAYDNLTDYELIKTHQAESKIQCLSLARNENNSQVATFNSSTGVCSAFRCRLGLGHCRKCRNSHQGNQIVWSANTSCWTTVQHRVSGSVDFYRYWSDYKAGFGEGPNENFWIGLNSLHNLTKDSVSGRQLRFLMKAWDNSESWAQYSFFSVGPESDGFRLSHSGFSGSPGVGNSFASVNGQRFSTRDKDQDIDGAYHCAIAHHGAWWYSNCLSAHPNGLYYTYPTAINTPFAQGVIWATPYGFYYSLKEIEILLL